MSDTGWIEPAADPLVDALNALGRAVRVAVEALGDGAVGPVMDQPDGAGRSAGWQRRMLVRLAAFIDRVGRVLGAVVDRATALERLLLPLVNLVTLGLRLL